MAIVLTKKKPVVEEVPALAPELQEIVELIDRIGPLQEEAELIAARIKQETERLKPYKDAMKELQTKVDALETDPDQPLEQLAKVFRMEAGAKGTSRSIKDLEKIKKFLGNKTFMELATVKLGDLDKYLTPPQLAEVLTYEHSSRGIRIIRRANVK